MKLADVQNKFKLHITKPVLDLDPDFHALYKSGNIPLEERFRVYRDNIVLGLTDILDQTFPSVSALTGKDFAHTLFRHFILSHLPQSGSLDDYGAELPEYINNLPQTQALPYLSDVARFDWLLSDCEQAANDTPLKVTDLEDVLKTENVTLSLRENACLLTSRFPITLIRSFALDPDNQGKSPPDIKSGGESVLIYRPVFKAEYLQLGSDEYFFLNHLKKNGGRLVDALELTLAKNVRFDLTASLQKFLPLDIFVKN